MSSETQPCEGCTRHQGEVIQKYCETCNELLCIQCLMGHSTEHKTLIYAHHLQDRKMDAEELSQRIEHIKAQICNLQKLFQEKRNKFCTGLQKTEEKINQSFQEVHKDMQEWELRNRNIMERKNEIQLQRLDEAHKKGSKTVHIERPKVWIRTNAKRNLHGIVRGLTPALVLSICGATPHSRRSSAFVRHSTSSFYQQKSIKDAKRSLLDQELDDHQYDYARSPLNICSSNGSSSTSTSLSVITPVPLPRTKVPLSKSVSQPNPPPNPLSTESSDIIYDDITLATEQATKSLSEEDEDPYYCELVTNAPSKQMDNSCDGKGYKNIPRLQLAPPSSPPMTPPLLSSFGSIQKANRPPPLPPLPPPPFSPQSLLEIDDDEDDGDIYVETTSPREQPPSSPPMTQPFLSSFRSIQRANQSPSPPPLPPQLLLQIDDDDEDIYEGADCQPLPPLPPSSLSPLSLLEFNEGPYEYPPSPKNSNPATDSGYDGTISKLPSPPQMTKPLPQPLPLLRPPLPPTSLFYSEEISKSSCHSEQHQYDMPPDLFPEDSNPANESGYTYIANGGTIPKSPSPPPLPPRPGKLRTNENMHDEIYEKLPEEPVYQITDPKIIILKLASIILNGLAATNPSESVILNDVCTGPLGSMVFTDQINLCIRILMTADEKPHKLAKEMRCQLQAVAYDQKSARIIVASEKGLYHLEFDETKPNKAKNPKLFLKDNYCMSITTKPTRGEETLIYAVTKKHGETFISCFKQNGQFVNKLEVTGTPCCIAYKDGYLVVATSQDRNLNKISTNGSPLWDIDVDARKKGVLFDPFRVAILPNHNIAVSERKQHCISVFSKEGQHILRFGQFGDEPGMFNQPTGIAVRLEKELVVVDSENKRIQIFDLDELAKQFEVAVIEKERAEKEESDDDDDNTVEL